MTTSEHTTVVIVGGGIGGLSTALALATSGLTVRVLEKEPEFEEVGAGLQMAPNATRILREWGVLDRAMDAGVFAKRLVLRDALDGRELTHLDLSTVEQRYGAPYFVMHRHDLLSALATACLEAGVELNTEVDVVDTRNVKGAAVAISETGEYRADAVFIADGLGSKLRRRFSDDEPVPSGYVAYRSALPTEEVEIEVTEDMLTSVVAYIGPGRHLVQYPLRRGEMFNTVAVFDSPSFHRGEARWGIAEELDGAFEGSCSMVLDGLTSLWRDRQWRMHDREPIHTWVDERIALMGDAAHPMLQYLAQGACQSIVDADCIAQQAAAHRGQSGIDWPNALLGYQAIRSPFAGRVQRNARTWGDLWHVDGFARTIRNQLLLDRSPDDFRHIDWLYGNPV